MFDRHKQKDASRRSLYISNQLLTAPITAAPAIPACIGSIRVSVVLFGGHPVCGVFFRRRDGTWKSRATVRVRRIRRPVFRRGGRQTTSNQDRCNGESTLHTEITRIRRRRSATGTSNAWPIITTHDTRRQRRPKDCSTSSSNPMMEGPWCRFRREARARE